MHTHTHTHTHVHACARADLYEGHEENLPLGAAFVALVREEHEHTCAFSVTYALARGRNESEERRGRAKEMKSGDERRRREKGGKSGTQRGTERVCV
jgi:hypothetical protein